MSIRAVSFAPSHLFRTCQWAAAPARALWTIGSWPLNALHRNLQSRLSLSMPTDSRLSSLQPLMKPTPVTPSAPLLLTEKKCLEETTTALQTPAKKIIDWKELTDVQVNEFSKRVSMNAMIAIMDPTLAQSISLKILDHSLQSRRSLLSVFMEAKGADYSLLRKINIKLRYFFLYYSGLIPNILNAFVESALAHLRSDLSKPEVRSSLINQCLSRINAFLTIYVKTIDAYAASNGEKSLQDLLSSALEKPIHRISRDFVEIALREFFPEVSLFKQLKSNRFYASSKILTCLPNAFLNWLIRKVLVRELPSLCQSLIQTTIQYTQPTNPPFVCAMTRGILTLLQQAKVALSQSQIPSAQPKSLSFTAERDLKEIVEKAYRIVHLQPYNRTPTELQAQIQSGPGIISLVLASQLKGLVTQVGRLGLSHLSHEVNPEELFYLLFQQVNACLAPLPQAMDLAVLKAKMHQEAKEVIHKGIQNATGYFRAPAQYLVGDKIMRLCNSGYEILLQHHVWKHLILDTLKSVSEYSPA